MDEYAGVLDSLADELYAAGAISDTYADLPFAERVCQVYVESQKVHAQYFDFSLPQKGNRGRHAILGRARQSSMR